MKKFTELASEAVLNTLVENLKKRNIIPHRVATKEEALAAIKNVIPENAEIATGSSETLHEIGFIEILKQKKHPWKNFKDNLFTEVDHLKREELRRESVLADYNIQSVHAITQSGQLIIASGMGNQIAAIAYPSKHIILVAGTQKVVKDLEEGIQRIHDYVIPLENERMKRIGFKKGTTLGKILIFEKETRKRDIHLILVDEVLGF
ncbi:lactate utilization protein [Galbibacter mesophilus]|uniref:lactate utilization protein n=1 Tax=Galbibacter mesophilus TaxID=379069 RepID=UPI00191E32FB|nr:lactate utilization protein [Galbibacter mesophilus]MCM5662198.1 lactate utilization protein [Galbibacter mesophilus]